MTDVEHEIFKIKLLAMLLTAPSKRNYEIWRETQIAVHGYDRFRELQNEAFKFLLNRDYQVAMELMG